VVESSALESKPGETSQPFGFVFFNPADEDEGGYVYIGTEFGCNIR